MQKKLSKMIETQEKQTTKRSRMMKNKTNRSILAAFISAATLMGAGMSLQADTVYWGNTDGNGGDGNWTDAGWYTTNNGDGTFSAATSQPGSADDVISGQTSNASTITVNSDVGTINSLFLTHNNSAPRTVSNLIIDNSGSLNITDTLRTHFSNAGATSSITVNDGGSLTVGGTSLLGMRFESGFNFVQNGGTTDFQSIILNQRGMPEVAYEMKSGNMSATNLSFGGGQITVQNSDARRFEISGGTVEITGAVADNDPGTYQVMGSGADSISIGSMTLDYLATDNGGPSKISFLLDEGGVTLTDISGAATFVDTVLQIGQMDGSALAPGTYNLLRANSGISLSGVTLQDNLTDGLSVSDWGVNSNSPDTLYVTVIPEPSTLLLLGLAGLAMITLRRKH